MSDLDWSKLNQDFHEQHLSREDNPYNRNQRYFEQALMFHLMAKHGLLREGEWLDWGCGEASLAIQLNAHFDRHLSNFDRYMRPKIFPLPESALTNGNYKLVVSTAVIEHVRTRDQLDKIEAYVASDGVLAIHTLIRENIPADPEWMYLLPVHCSFFSNESMERLLSQWGYTCSTYNPQSKTWVCFREPVGEIALAVNKLNTLMGWTYLHFKVGFMNYWA